jgi:hypothetical protein
MTGESLLDTMASPDDELGRLCLQRTVALAAEHGSGDARAA